MAKLTIKTNKTLNEVLNKLTPSWEGCFPKSTIEKAQERGQSRNYVFGKIINAKFIRLTKASAGFKKGVLVSLTDIYDDESASNITGLIIYRLANSGLLKEPEVVEA